MLRKRDAGTGKINFVDIASDSYEPSENANIDFEAAMGRIHGIQRDGTIVTNVEVWAKPRSPVAGLSCTRFVKPKEERFVEESKMEARFSSADVICL